MGGFVNKAKNGLILLLLGGIAGAGLVLWLTRKKKAIAAPAMEPLSLSGAPPTSRPAPRYEPSQDEEAVDADIDFEGGSEF